MSEDARDGGAAGARAETEAGAEAEAPPTHPRVRLSVENFGPIEKGEVELRPLNVFVGPSNTGKTYLAVLIHCLHRVLGGFSGFPTIDDPFNVLSRFYPDLLDYMAHDISKEEVDALYEKMRSDGAELRFADFPKKLQRSMNDLLSDELMKDLFVEEINDSFDTETLSDLSSDFTQNGIRISLILCESAQNYWNFRVHAEESTINVNFCVNNLPVFMDNGKIRRMEINFPDSEKKTKYVTQKLIDSTVFSDYFTRYVHYLPAARTGIMLTYRVVVSSLMRRGTRASRKRLRELPTISTLLANFITRLIEYEEPGGGGKYRQGRERSEEIENMGAVLERETLQGKIQAVQRVPGGLAEFVYRPRNTEQDIGLSRASSMVTELAPLILFLRDRNNGVRPGDTLIIEEPEAHLHPAAQTEMAKLLAELANAGVQAIVTTHSDFLVQEIGNLMRAGELAAKTGGKEGGETRLRPEDVGVWLFRRGEEGAGSTVEEIPFDRIEGVEPPEYNEIYEEIYNRSATLQNRLAEAGLETPE